MKCFFCKGPAHPQTGCEYHAEGNFPYRTLSCETCTRRLWKWFREKMHCQGAKQGLLFYEHIECSNRKLLIEKVSE